MFSVLSSANEARLAGDEGAWGGLVGCSGSISSRLVAIAYLIVARTASMFGVHCSRSVGSFPPRLKDRLLLLVSVCCSICVRRVVHVVHRNRKCLTVSFACPQVHWSDSVAPIRCRYPLSRVMPVRSCASIFASLRLRVLVLLRTQRYCGLNPIG